MTYKNAKTILFASLLVAMILPFSNMDISYAEEQKEPDKLFKKFLNQAKKLQRTQEKLDSEHTDQERIQKLQERVNKIQQRMDNLQQKYIKSISLTDEKVQELEKQGLKVFNEFSDPNSSLYLGVEPDSYFVSKISKKTHLIFENQITSKTNTLSASAVKTQLTANEGEFEGIPYSIGFIEKSSHFISCSDRVTDCNYLMGGLAVDQGGETSTLSFWGKQTDGDVGFVMTAHGANYQGAIIEQYPNRDVGTVDTITSESWGECDCAFVKVPSYTVVKKIYKSSGVANSITSYSTGNPVEGTWLQVSGVSSNIKYGTYEGFHPIYKMMIDVSLEGGDSGSPVTSIGSNIKVYGMIHAAGSSLSYATPYSEIKTELDLQ